LDFVKKMTIKVKWYQIKNKEYIKLNYILK
jgi:hypothetical protein